MKAKTILLALSLAFSSMAQAQDIKFTKITPPWVTVQREGITNLNVVISKADNTDTKLEQLGRQLCALTAGDIATSIGIYTSVWAAKAGPEETLSKAEQIREGKEWVGMFRRRNGVCTLEYTSAGMSKGAGENLEANPDFKTLQLP
jgi:hypothetical protein